ncbi:hypothetical protein MPER_09965 [Moniliophthora perniciosa FA553]|nr:hypothetical protein MPER_09965 [Moniliophthora perniciosa FA553]
MARFRASHDIKSFNETSSSLEMAKSKGGFYAVHTGRIPGIYSTWTECEAQVKGFANAKYKKFSMQEEAEEFLKDPKNPYLQGEQSSSSSTTTTEIGKRRPLEDNADVDAPPSKQQKVVFESDNSTDEDDLVVYCDGASRGMVIKGRSRRGERGGP